MSTAFKNKTSLRTIEAQIVQNLRTMRLGQNLPALIKKKESVYAGRPKRIARRAAFPRLERTQEEKQVLFVDYLP